jgi:hypothetical protein
MNKSIRLKIHPSEFQYNIHVTDEEPFISLAIKIRSLS